MDFPLHTFASYRHIDAKDDLFQKHYGLSSSTIEKPPVPHQLPTVPQPMDTLQSSAPPPFLTKTYDMVDDPATDEIVSWSSTNNSFVVWNFADFSRDLLPKFFKHNNFSSFVRQLNTYGFRKVGPDRWEFANEGFLRGQRQLLKSIHRRKPAQSQSQQQGQGPLLEVGKFGGIEGELDRLKRDKHVLMFELVRMRTQQQATEQNLRVMGQRLHVTEQRQGQMMSFLAKAVQNPSFFTQLMQQYDASERLSTVKKRRRLPKQGNEGVAGVFETSTSEGPVVKYQLASGSEHPNSMLFEFLNSSGVSKKVNQSSNLVDRPGELEERTADGEEDEYSSPGSQTEFNITESHASTTGISQRSQIASERKMFNRSQVQAFPSTPSIPIVGDIRSSADHGLGGGDISFFERGFSGEVERFSHERGASGSLHNGVGMNDSFWEQFLGGKLDSGDSATDADVSSGSGSGDQDGEYEAGPHEWWTNKPNMEQVSFDFEARPLLSK
ncbi:hypothetical protein O6H91_Y236000 [Diphasiastrum complanatum]|nr:hypothetical protein O6H91_Y236000 [Diphasiastrum complanatum]